MGDHKSVAITQQCVKGPSVIRTTKHCHRKQTFAENGQVSSKPVFTGDTIESLLIFSNGDIIKATRLLETRLAESRAKIAALTASAAAGGGGDANFDARLAVLKAEQRRTVDLCEGLYYMSLDEQQQKRQQQPQKTVAFRPPVESVESAVAAQRTSADFIRASLAELESRAPPLEAEKPPRPRPRKPDGNRGDDRAWPPTQGSSESGAGGVGDDENEALRRGYQELLRSRVKAMWSDFDVSEARGGLQRTSSLDRGMASVGDGVAATSKQPVKEAKWTKSTTVPQPFTMTLRDAGADPSLRKSRSMLQFEAEQQQRQHEEEAACRVRFHANPIPAHVQMPLYQELVEQHEARRLEVRQRSRDLLTSMEQPFNFTERKRTETTGPIMNMEGTASSATVTTFRANPVPPSCGSGEAVRAQQQRRQEDELLRQIKIKMRSEETLRRSATPGEMATRQHRMEESRKARLDKYGGGDTAKDGKRRPRSADAAVRKRRSRGADPPDFKRLHWAFGQELLGSQRRQAPVRVTRPKPFQLRTEQRGERASASTGGLAPAAAVVGGRSGSSSSIVGDFAGRTQRTLVRHEEAPPARLTQSAMLREAQRGTERQAAERRRGEAKSATAKRETRRRELVESIRQSLDLAASASGPSVQELTRKRLESQREFEEAYKQRLREMNEKIKQRDLLVVQQAKLIAQQRAQAKYQKTLQDAGVDPQEVDENAKKYQEGDLQSYTQEFDADSAEEFADDDDDNSGHQFGSTMRPTAASPVAEEDED